MICSAAPTRRCIRSSELPRNRAFPHKGRTMRWPVRGPRCLKPARIPGIQLACNHADEEYRSGTPLSFCDSNSQRVMAKVFAVSTRCEGAHVACGCVDAGLDQDANASPTRRARLWTTSGPVRLGLRGAVGGPRRHCGALCAFRHGAEMQVPLHRPVCRVRIHEASRTVVDRHSLSTTTGSTP